MNPELTKKFMHFITVAKNKIEAHKGHQDAASMRCAMFSCGLVVGFFQAHDCPVEWRDDIDALQNNCFDNVGPC